MFNIIILLFLQLIFSLSPQTESHSVSTVDFIQVQGNQKTKDYIILREVQQNLYSPWTEESIIEDKNRIYNLGLFSSVHIDVITNEENKNIYMITVSEMWYIWQFPIIKYDNQSNNFSYGGGMMHNNFRGRDENLALGATFGNIREYFLWYKNPWISGDHRSLELGAYNESSDHHVYNIIEKDKGLFAEGGFYRGDNHKFNFGILYNNKLIESIEDDSKDTLLIKYLAQVDFTYIRINSNYRYDTRDIYIDPSSGFFLEAEINNIFGINRTQNIYEFELDFNVYHNLLSGYFNPVIKYNFLSNFQYSSSSLPIFSKNYIGGQDYIRGYSAIPSENPMDNYSDIIEVDNFVINTFEIQSTIVKRKEYLEGVEMGLDFTLFADWGLGYNLNNSINWNNAIYGYGLGLRIFLMGGVIKLDFGFNPYGTSRLHLF